MREVAPFVLLVCACGAAVGQTQAQPAAPPSQAEAAPSSSSPPAAETLAAFEALAARGPSVAPGMREVARRESSVAPVELARADGRDLCLRVAFAASTPVTASLLDAKGNVLATQTEPATDGVLGEKGPVCIRRGDVVRGTAPSAGAPVRWLAWEAP